MASGKIKGGNISGTIFDNNWGKCIYTVNNISGIAIVSFGGLGAGHEAPVGHNYFNLPNVLRFDAPGIFAAPGRFGGTIGAFPASNTEGHANQIDIYIAESGRAWETMLLVYPL